MGTNYKIRIALRQFMDAGEANACQVFKGYNLFTNKTGWHYVPFGGQAVYLGKSEAEALAEIEWISNARLES